MNDQGRNRTDATADDDSISLQPYLDTLQRYRRIISLAVLAMSAVFVAGILVLLAIYPTERVASVRFRLLFDGAGLGQYPNKTPFSSAEIVAHPIVTEVFKANDLQQYGTYESFKNALFVQQSNPALDLLALQYQSMLTDPKLTAVDRTRIEAEFAQKRAALTDPSFSLSLRRSERFKTLPDSLAEKILNDTLTAWAVQAERLGAMNYEVPILSGDVLSKDKLDGEDYLVAAEQLRALVVRLLDTVAKLEKIPGALTTRTSTGGVSLPEIWANLDNTLRFNLEPLLGMIRSEGVTKNARQLKLYASAQVYERQLERQAAEARARAVQSALGVYTAQRDSRASSDAVRGGANGGARPQGFDQPALIPQLSEAFLERLAEISATSQKSEFEYRQKLTDMVIKENIQVTELNKDMAFYEDILKSVQGAGSGPAGSAEAVELVKTRSQAAFSSIEKSAKQLIDMYTELSAKNLNPEARLYTITGPFGRHTEGSLSYRSVVLSFVLMLMLTLTASIAGCFIHDSMKAVAR